MIGDSYKTNFDTILAAAENKDLCLMEVYDRLTGEPSVMLCAGYVDENEDTNIIPLAQMCSYNPYEKFVNEPEMITKYRSVGMGIARVADSAWLELVQDVPYVNGTWARAYAVLKDHLNDDDARAELLTPQFVADVFEKIEAAETPWHMSAKELDSWIHHAEHPEEARKEEPDGTSDEATVDGEA